MRMFLSSKILIPPPWVSKRMHCHLYYGFQRHKIPTMSTTNVSLFWSNSKGEESPVSLCGSIAPVGSHPSLSKEVALSQSRPLGFSSLLATTEGGSEFRIVQSGLGCFGVNSKEGGIQKKKTQVRELRQQKAKSLRVRKVLVMP